MLFLSGQVWIDEMRFAPTRASGFVDGVWTTYAGRIAKDAYMEVAFDFSDRGFCHLYAKKLGTPISDISAKLFRKTSIGREAGVHPLLNKIRSWLNLRQPHSRTSPNGRKPAQD